MVGAVGGERAELVGVRALGDAELGGEGREVGEAQMAGAAEP
jgi:hypothetical protein